MNERPGFEEIADDELIYYSLAFFSGFILQAIFGNIILHSLAIFLPHALAYLSGKARDYILYSNASKEPE